MNRFLLFIGLLCTAYGVQASDLELVSVVPSSGPIAVAGSSYLAQLSGTGRFVLFESNAALAGDDNNTVRDVYIFDRKTKVLKRITPGDEPLRANAGGAISDSGGWIAFHSYPPSAVLNLSTRTADIYVYNYFRRQVEMVTPGRNGELNNGEALYPSLNADGRLVVFTSNATNLVEGVTREMRQVYLLDRRSDELQVVSRSTEGVLANRPCGDARISANGRFIAYRSAATNLTPGLATNSIGFHLYLLDRWKGKLLRIDDWARGFDIERWTIGGFSMDANAEAVVFETRPRQLEIPSLPPFATDIFIFDREKGTVEPLSKGIFQGKSHEPALSSDGRYVAFSFRGFSEQEDGLAGIIVHDRRLDVWKRAVAGSCYNPSFSADGMVLAFESDDPNLMAGAPKEIRGIYVVRNPFK